MIDALRRQAQSMWFYYGYARSDRGTFREPITAKLLKLTHSNGRC